MIPFARLATAERLNEIGSTLGSIVASLDVDEPRASALGEAGWAATWSAQRRRQLAEDLGEALALATSMKDPRPAEALLDAMRPTSAAGGRFDAGATWAALSQENRQFLTGSTYHPRSGPPST